MGFKMKLNYPKYIGKKPQILDSTGNAIIPQGTTVTWDMMTKNTDQVQLKTSEKTYDFIKDKEHFNFNKRIHNNFKYNLTTSNTELKEYENLSFMLSVIRD